MSDLDKLARRHADTVRGSLADAARPAGASSGHRTLPRTTAYVATANPMLARLSMM